MSKDGIVCTAIGAAGALVLAFGINAHTTAQGYREMSPNELADTLISDAQRHEFSAITQAVYEQTGPIYTELKASCQKDADKISNMRITYPFTTQAATGNTMFNVDQCIENGLKQAEKTLPYGYAEKGLASREYQYGQIAEMNQTANKAAGLGTGLLTIGGLMFFGSRKKSGPTATPT